MGKRIFDLVLSAAGLILLAPFLLILALLIKLDSEGPVFYRGKRTGRYGKPFLIWKFRTMVPRAEQLGGGTTAFKDPRITRIGRFLRKYKLDELPQLWNVLWGEMSLVGPRPELMCYTEKYTPEERVILSVRPGITDFSSLEYSSLSEVVGETDADRNFEEKVLARKNALRLRYVRERNFLLDLRLIFRTLLKVVSKTGERSSKEKKG